MSPTTHGPDIEWTACDGCGEEFDAEDMHNHDDGNTYCEECNYPTAQDIADGLADEAMHCERDDL